MPGTDLKRRGHGSLAGTVFQSRADASGPRSRPWVSALLLSLVIHAGGLLLFWAFSWRSPGGTVGFSVVDTRVAAVAPEADFLVTFPDETPRPRLKTSPPSAVALAPAVGQAGKPDRHKPDGPAGKPDLHQPGRPKSGEGRRDGGSGDGRASAGAANSFFQIPIRGQRLIFVIDRSASMGLNGAFTAARRELLACLDHLAPEAQFQVIAYNRGAETLRVEGQSGLLSASADRKQQARRLIEALRAEGGTNHLAALKRALLLRPDVIFLLTDADDLTEAQVREVTRFNRGRTVIHTVELTDSLRDPGSNPLQLLAVQNRGMYRGVALAQDDRP